MTARCWKRRERNLALPVKRKPSMAKILLVDDEPSARTTLGLLLKRRGHVVQEAEGVVAAAEGTGWRHIRSGHHGFVDARWPGLEVLQTARVRCPDANVILLTAHPGWESAREAMRLGAFDYFEKGPEPDGLFQRIDKALAEQALRRRKTTGMGWSPFPALPRPGPGRRAPLPHRPLRRHARIHGAARAPRPRGGPTGPGWRDRAHDGRRTPRPAAP